MAKKGRPTKYRDDYHPDKLIELAEQGYSVESYCYFVGIDKPTYYDWIKKIERFSNAHAYANVARVQWWQNKGLNGLHEGKNFNDKLFALMCRWSTKAAVDERRVDVQIDETASYTEQSAQVLKALRDGHLTPTEAERIQNTIAKAAQVSEVTDLREKLEQIKEAKGEED